MIVNKLAYKIIEIGNLVFNELGGGFNENVHQVGLAIELREAKIKYLRETNIEIFYKSLSLLVYDQCEFFLIVL